jgi:signal transduction histidine kinase
MFYEFDARKLYHWLTVFAMLCRVLALTYGLILVLYHPHPVLAARTDRLLTLWAVAAIYTLLLIGILAVGRGNLLREPLFLTVDALFCVGLLVVAGGGHRNIFALYSWVPILNTSLSLLGSKSLLKRVLLLGAIVALLTGGFVLSMLLDSYTFEVVLERREIDEVFLRTSSYPVLGLVLGFLSFLMELWQRSLERMNALRAEAAIEAERKRIAMDIHDGVLSQLSALVRRAEYAEVLLAEAPDQAQAELSHIVTLAGDIHADIRWIVKALRQDPTHINLGEVIEGIVTRFQRNTGLPVALDLPDTPLTVPFDTVRQMGHIVEEALTNVWKHSRCQHAQVSLHCENGTALLKIEDDGVGFDPDAVTETTGLAGLGLTSIRERAQRVGGRVELLSQPGQGTRVIVHVPLPEGADPNEF